MNVEPNEEYSTVERTDPYEFTLRKFIGGRIVSNVFQVREIEGMELPDLKALYETATTGSDGSSLVAKFISKSKQNKNMRSAISRDKNGHYQVQKESDEGIGHVGGPEEALPELHRAFTEDFENRDYSPTWYLEIDENGDPEIIVFDIAEDL